MQAILMHSLKTFFTILLKYNCIFFFNQTFSKSSSLKYFSSNDVHHDIICMKKIEENDSKNSNFLFYVLPKT